MLAGKYGLVVVGLELEVGELNDLADGEEVIILLVGDDLCHLGLVLLQTDLVLGSQGVVPGELELQLVEGAWGVVHKGDLV